MNTLPLSLDLPTDEPAPRRGSADAEKLLEGLNPQQREAVLHSGSPLLIVAGAGSGKTAVLTRRIAYLLAKRDTAPGQILAITFTNKAAAEMRERVVGLVGRRAQTMWISTFHASCVRILRAQSTLLEGLNSNFSIYDADDSRRLLSMIVRDFDLDAKKFTPRMFATGISNLKNELISPAEAEDQAGAEAAELPRLVSRVYAEYQRRLRAANAFDFDDLIGEAVALLKRHPAVAEYYRRKFRHILVDEYQDTNHAQYMLVKELVGPEDNTEPTPGELCVVGDADQSIYAFRGATIRNIEEFERDYPSARTILLEQNYRSTQNILAAANALISKNAGRREKRLWTDLGDGELVTGYVADNEHDEAAFVAREIDRLSDTSEAKYSEVAVFYRTNSASRSFEEIFIRMGLPYKVVGGVRFYERKEVRDVVAYLRSLDNPEDSVNLRRILNTPRRGIGDRAEACVAVYAEQQDIGFGAALRAAGEGQVPFLNARSAKLIAQFLQMMDDIRSMSHPADGTVADIGDVVDEILDRTGYRSELSASNDPQDGARLENLQELVNVAREFSSDARNAEGLEQELPEGSAEPGSLAAFLERVSLVADTDQIPDDDQGVVTLMTLHTAKGLEFPVVFLTGWEDGQFPHMRALGDPVELAEERRLAYVGITRARQRLYLSRAVVRSSWGQPMSNPESRFFGEIPQELIDWRRLDPQRTFGRSSNDRRGRFNESEPNWRSDYDRRSGSDGRGASYRGNVDRPRPSSTPSFGRTGAPAPKLGVGDRVNHDKYGLGSVTESSPVGGIPSVIIDFGSNGKVRLALIPGVPLTKL